MSSKVDLSSVANVEGLQLIDVLDDIEGEQSIHTHTYDGS